MEKFKQIGMGNDKFAQVDTVDYLVSKLSNRSKYIRHKIFQATYYQRPRYLQILLLYILNTKLRSATRKHLCSSILSIFTQQDEAHVLNST